MAISIFNDVLGPVMRGPSSSHTAGSFHIGRIVRDLCGTGPGAVRGRTHVRFTFDPRGSYAQVFREQGVDRGFAAGLLGWTLTDPRFLDVLELAPGLGLDLHFEVAPLEGAAHPNTVDIEATPPDDGQPDTIRVRARSVGGGSVEIVSIDGWPVRVTGETFEVLAIVEAADAAQAVAILSSDHNVAADTAVARRDALCLLHARRYAALPHTARAALERLASGGRPREIQPIAILKRGPSLFESADQMTALAASRRWSLGRVALAHEASLLATSEHEARVEMLRRLDVMAAAVSEGLSDGARPMQLLQPSARRVLDAESAGRLAVGGLHTRAAARALAAMHANSRMGVVCAAPTGGSSGVLPGVMVTLMERSSGAPGFSPVNALARDAAALALFAAGAVGVVVAARGTFAAEVAGCQVEIGAAGAMAAAAVVEAAGGTAAQAADAAAIAFQNTMGSVCDLVQGIVEIPCHTRNAVAASSAFVCADLVLGGYVNPIPLDETVDAVLAVGRMLPPELRCTARGGLATTPSALAMKRRIRS